MDLLDFETTADAIENAKDFYRNVVLYSITGCFIHRVPGSMFTDNSAVFGGYLKLADDGSFLGEMVDGLGPSCITGLLDGDHLNFTKCYLNPQVGAHPYAIQYNFIKSNDHWVGHYFCSFEEMDIESFLESGKYIPVGVEDLNPDGNAKCVLAPVFEDAYHLIPGPRSDLR